MANSSNKNFPHAYGAGRVIAAFSLSHPGGPGGVDVYSPSQPDMMPPAINGDMDQSALPEAPGVNTSWKPYDPADPPGGLGELTFVFGPDQQPYNATSFGVNVTGSGTKSLPYKRALAPYVPASVSPLLNSILPGTSAADNEVRPFKVVEEAQLGSTHGQFVMVTEVNEDSGVIPAEDGPAYYEVGLNWKIPPLRGVIRGEDPSTAFVDSNWPAQQVASIRDSLASTLWVNASFGDNGLTTAHPALLSDVPVGNGPNAATWAIMNSYLTSNPIPAGQPNDPTGKGGWEAPYGSTFGWSGFPALGGSLVGPAFAPDNDGGFMESNDLPLLHANIHVKITSGVQRVIDVSEDFASFGPNFGFTVDLELAPVVRIYALYRRELGEGAVRYVPLPLARAFMRPCDDEEGLQPPCINVQVFQKNSSAPDGTIKPAYDLLDQWTDVGRGAP